MASAMRYLRLLTACLSILLLALPAEAWGAAGHRIVAAIAYDQLKPNTRARVDALIKAHPDYARFIQGAPEDPSARAREAFIAASVWADNIKGDPRFYDETRKDAKPTPQLPGFPTMERHTHWHYYDMPYTPDGAAPKKPDEQNALTEVSRMIKEIGHAPVETAAYDLPWIEHIVGDLGQPLHDVSLILKSLPDGDQGGNLVFIAPRGNLHSLWDGAPGQDTSDAAIDAAEKAAIAAYPAPPRIEKNPKKWIQEGYHAAVTNVYTFGFQTGTRDHPITLPANYTPNARKFAEGRLALAGYRLAAVLNDKLR
jgi:hypothetical protein